MLYISTSVWNSDLHEGSGYFAVKTALLPLFLVKKLLHGGKAERKTASNQKAESRGKDAVRPETYFSSGRCCVFHPAYAFLGMYSQCRKRPLPQTAVRQMQIGGYFMW